jgi:hypothetical protein
MFHGRQAAMREFVFSEEVLAEIRHDRYHHPPGPARIELIEK